MGSACVIALLDIRGHNPCSRIPRSKMKTLERVRNSVLMEVKGRKDYLLKQSNAPRRGSASEFVWKRVVDSIETTTPAQLAAASAIAAGPGAARGAGVGMSSPFSSAANSAKVSEPGVANESVAFCISMKDGHKWERRRRTSSTMSDQSQSDHRSSEAPPPPFLALADHQYPPHQQQQQRQQRQETAVPVSGAISSRSTSTGGRLQEGHEVPHRLSSASNKERRNFSPSTNAMVVAVGNNNSSSSGNYRKVSNIVLDREYSVSGDEADIAGRAGFIVSLRNRSSTAAAPSGSSSRSGSKERLGGLLNSSSKDKLREQSISCTPSTASFSSDINNSSSSKPRTAAGGAAGGMPALNLQSQLVLLPASLSARREGSSRDIPVPPMAKRMSPVSSVHATSSSGTSSSSTSSKVFTGRKILGKTLHAAGVALIMSTNSSDSLSSQQDGGNSNSTETALGKSSVAVTVSPRLREEKAVSGSASDDGYSIAYEEGHINKPFIPFPMKPSMAGSSSSSNDSATTALATSIKNASLVGYEDSNKVVVMENIPTIPRPSRSIPAKFQADDSKILLN